MTFSNPDTRFHVIKNATNHRYVQAKFRPTLLHPRYWVTWLGIGLLYLVVLLPYPVLRRLGKGLGRLAMLLMKKRVKITQRNLQLCFPSLPQQQRDEWVRKNFESTGMGVLETGMAWFWPNWRISRWSKVIGMENMTQARKNGRGVLVIGMHFLTLELGARICGMHTPGVAVYRPNDNKLMDWIQLRGRLRSAHYLLDRRNVKGMIRALQQGELLWYAPDHDYGPRNSVFAPLFAVEKAATTQGTLILVKMSNPAVVPFTPIRNADDSGYTLFIQPILENFPVDDKIAAATYMNQAIEKEIMLAPEQYMWLHRRFKTRPPGEPSLY